jgi:hypothetical protein
LIASAVAIGGVLRVAAACSSAEKPEPIVCVAGVVCADAGVSEGGKPDGDAIGGPYFEPKPAGETPIGNWGLVDVDLPTIAFRITGLVARDGKVYLAGGEYKSAVGGLFEFLPERNAWQKRASHETSGALVAAADNAIYMLVGKSLYRYPVGATPGASTWQSRADSPIGNNAVAANVGSKDAALYVASETWQVARYLTALNKWEVLPTGSAALDPGKLGRVSHLAVTADETVFLSTPYSIRDSKGDLGAVYALPKNGTWQDATYNLRAQSGGLPTNMLNQTGNGWGPFGSVAVGPAASDAVYGSTEQGLFRLGARDTQWEKVAAYSGNSEMRSSDAYLFSLQRQVQMFETATRRRPLGQPKLFGCAKETWEQLTAPTRSLVIGVIRTQECRDGVPDRQRVVALRIDPNSPAIDRNMQLDVGTYLGASAAKGKAELAWNEAGSELFAGAQTGAMESSLYRIDAAGKTRRELKVTHIVHDLAAGPSAITTVEDDAARTYDLGLTAATASVPLAAGDKRLARAADGTLAILAGKTVSLHNGDLSKLRETTLVRAYVTDIAIDASAVYVVGFDNQRNGEPVQVPFLLALSRTDLSPLWKTWGYEPAMLSADMADSRLYRISIGANGDLYVLGEFAGGNTVFRWNGKDLQTSTLNAYDDTSRSTNTKSEHKLYYARVDTKTGSVKQGQFAIARLPNGAGNTVKAGCIAADARGRMFIGATSAAFMVGRDLNLINGEQVGAYDDGDAAYLAVDGDFRTRLRFTPLSKAGGNGIVQAIAVSATGVVAALTVSEQGQLFTTDASRAPFPAKGDVRDNLHLALFREP